MDESRIVRCSCGDEFALPLLREHRLSCEDLHRELARRKRLLFPPDWMRDARCVTHSHILDSEDFFVDDASYQHTNPIEKAKRCCALCPVRRLCLEYAFSHDATLSEGVYAGTRGRDREAHRDNPERIEFLLDSERRYAVEHDLLMRAEVEEVA